MSLFVATYRYHPDAAELDRLRPERYEFFRRLQSDGVLVASGRLMGDESADGMLVVRASDAPAASTLLEADPYIRAGLVAERRLAQWEVTLGDIVQG